MSSNPVWERVCAGTRRIVDTGKAVWCEVTESRGADTAPLPEAMPLEDRVFFNAAPVDMGGVLNVFTQTGTLEGAPADGVAAGDAGTGGQAAHAAAAPTQSALDVSALGDELIAPDLYISVNPEDRIIASYDLGGDKNPHGRNVSMNIDKTGWERFINDHLEPIIKAGVSRIELHTPFGQRSVIVDPVTGAITRPADQWGFQFDAYLDAQQEVPKLTADFVSAFQSFFARHEKTGKVDEVIPYIGSPRLDPDQTALTNNPDAWWDRAYDVLTPMFEAGFRSIGFDASATAAPGTLDYELHNVLRYPELRDPVRDARLIEIVGNERVEVFLEAMPNRSVGRTDFPVLVLDPDYTHQDPERPGSHFSFRQKTFYEHDRLTGEMIRIVRHEQWKKDGIGAVENILLDGDVAAVTPTYFLRPKLGGATTLAGYIDKLDLPSLPTDVDLDPDDLNPDSAKYTITQGPQHGTLTPNRFHDDVFTYTPDPYYTGVDSFEYVVRDASGGSETAVVNFFVNTEVVVPPTPAEPAEPTGSGPPDPPVVPPGTPTGSAEVSPSGSGNVPPPVATDNPPVLPIPSPDVSGGPSPPPVGPPVDSGTGGGGANPLPLPPINLPADPPASGPANGPAQPPASDPLPPVDQTDPPPSNDSVDQGGSASGGPSGEDGGASTAGGQGQPPATMPTGQEMGGTTGSPNPTSPPVGAGDVGRDEDAPPSPVSMLDMIKQLAGNASTGVAPVSSSGAGVIDPGSQAVLLELNDLGLFASARSVELLDQPEGPTVRVQYGFGVLQFLLSSVNPWVTRQV